MSAPRTKIVAVIDDDLYLRESLQDLLETAGHIGELYESAEDFLSRKGFLTADFILTDLRMTGMTGVDLLRTLRSDGHQQPVLIMTSYPDIVAKTAAFKSGASAFLSKPFSSAQLLDCLQ